MQTDYTLEDVLADPAKYADCGMVCFKGIFIGYLDEFIPVHYPDQ